MLLFDYLKGYSMTQTLSVADTSPVTPMMAQWMECKGTAKDALLLFRLGDFYEAFHEDAKIMAKELNLTLTSRQNIPMCGVPFHTSEVYIDKLIAKGFKVAIAEQMESPKEAKGLVKREITQIITPGTLVNSGLLSDKKNNFFASLAQIGSTFGLSFLDLSTGEFHALELDSEQDVLDELFRLRPSEFLVGKKFQEIHPLFFKELSHHCTFLINTKDPLIPKTAQDVLTCQFEVNNLSSFGLNSQAAAVSAAGSLLLYLKEEMNLNLDHILSIQTQSFSEYMSIDRATLRNLELTESILDSSHKNTLLDVLDTTCTPMGGRLLCQWIKHPSMSLPEIQKRQDAIQTFLKFDNQRIRIRGSLDHIRDLERLSMKLTIGSASPRDLLALGKSLASLPFIQQELSSCEGFEEFKNLPDLQPLAQKILLALSDNPPLRIGEGDIFKDGFNQELDELRSVSKESFNFLTRYQNSLREETGIKSLKVSFTKAFGYYIEVTRSHGDKVPAHFQRRQTLVSAERFVTDELKKFEHQILSAEERSKALECHLFEEFRSLHLKEAPSIHTIAKAIGRLDCLLALSKIAKENNYVRPTIDESTTLHIQKGRHPIVEKAVGSAHYIANDTALNEKEQMMLITGPNMAGKSTYIRQVAILAILAQMGSFVPAESAHIGLIDKVFSRIGASDDLARGQSTFMVEMSETANILKNATSRSLVLLDEIGRGTSTYDGISIAWAVAEYLLTTHRKQAKTLFATHYWELTALAKQFPHAMNFQIAVQETEGGIVFLRKIIRGGTDKSYGIHVAKLAGLPSKAIQRAEEMLKTLETKGSFLKPQKEEKQLTLFEPELPSWTQELKQLDLSNLTPLQALQKLAEWQSLL